MTAQIDEPLIRIAERVADCFAERGYAYIEDDKIEVLAAALKTFLTTTGIPTHPTDPRA